MSLIPENRNNTLNFPVLGPLLRLLLVTTGLFWLTATTPVNLVLALVAFAVVAYGAFVTVALKCGPWRNQVASAQLSEPA